MGAPYRFTREYQFLVDHLNVQINSSKDREEIQRLKRMRENFQISKILEEYKEQMDALAVKKLPKYVEFQFIDEKGKLHSLCTARTDSLMVNGREATVDEIASIIKPPLSQA